MRQILVWAEITNEQIADVSLDALRKATQLAGSIHGSVGAILIGDGCRGSAEDLIRFGADRVWLVEDSRLTLYQSDPYARIVTDIIREVEPEIVLMGGTSIGMDLAPRVAAKLKTGLTAHCVDLHIEKINGEEQLIQVVPGWGGQMMVKISCPEHRPQMATIRPGVMEKGTADPARTGEIITVTPEITEDDLRAKTLEMISEEERETPLEDARIVVSGGFGLYGSGGFDPVERLAAVLHGEVAGTRPAFDQGWIPESRMIGQSGKTVRPDLFVSVGASGAMHYTTGFLKSKVIVAIDRNPNAPIFDIADFGIADDLNRIIPSLIKELENQE
ncbi:MAG: electron transfer flavoprotein subunit alpha/FixB family protein [Deltaproteobacteria bacterium]|nr:electron transfer flavoprotein subunit alpha/FixB family protein [Deltaproteobacteria bacterium]